MTPRAGGLIYGRSLGKPASLSASPSMRPARVVVASLLAVLAAGSCARARPRSVEAPRAPAVLRVDNRAQQDVTVYLVRGTYRLRLGSVTGLSAHAFEIAPNEIDPSQEVYLIADPLAGSGRLASERIVLRPGSIVEWTIEMELRRAVLSVY